MLYTKPQGHWPFGSGEEDFWKIFTIYGRGGHLGHVTQFPWTNFRSPIPLRLHMKFGFDWPSGFGEEDLWKWWMYNGHRTDDRPWLYSKLTNEPKGSGELKINSFKCQNHQEMTFNFFHPFWLNLSTTRPHLKNKSPFHENCGPFRKKESFSRKLLYF